MISRRIFLATFGGGLLAAPLAAEAQKPGKIGRVGVLNLGPAPSPDEVAKAVSRSPFYRALKEFGWVVGQNLVVERRWGHSLDELHAAVADLVRLQVDVLVVPSAALARIAQLETNTIPIVVAGAGGDLVAAGLVASLARPGGNLTGVQILSDDLIPKRFELLQALVPKLSRVASLGEDVTMSALPQMPSRYRQQAAATARTLGIHLDSLVVHSPGDFADAFSSMTKNGDQGLLVASTPFMAQHRNDIVALAAKHRIVTIYETQSFVETGGLLSYGVNFSEVLRRAAVYVDKILKGAKPADLPVEQPTKFELVINLKTAKALGLTIPPSLLARADQVIE